MATEIATLILKIKARRQTVDVQIARKWTSLDTGESLTSAYSQSHAVHLSLKDDRVRFG
ncbi:hypothetical protein [Burkholderia stagnalis]|uniref:hypothetical protein n=1 Tax=Burkholderia stagnalis TaxID=1503054 RepID=UPI0012D8608D|nr:hypothetical protein [Burkholderia stagnalis]